MEQIKERKVNKKFAWLKRFGVVGFLFFLIKGILWLVLFGLLAFGILDEGTVQKVKDIIPF